MECHRCEHQADMAAGKYAGMAWEKTPCGKCRFEDRDSRYTIEYDAERDSAACPPVVGVDDEDRLPVGVLVDAMSLMVDMPAVALRIVRGRLARRSYADIGEELGVSAARVEALHRRALVRWPALWALFPVKLARAQRRATEQAAIKAGLPGNGGIPRVRPAGCGRKGHRGKGRKNLAAKALCAG